MATQPESLAVDLEEYVCMVRAVHFEAEGESKSGKQAVANVILNRVKSSKFPNTICGVIEQGQTHANGVPKKNKCHFSWYCDGKSDDIKIKNKPQRNSFEETALIAFKVVNGELGDITYGANHYYAHDKVTPYWKSDKDITIVVDNHTFVKL